MNASRLLVLSIVLSPAILLGQKKEELVSIQRDVAQLEDNVKQLQKSLDEKMAALTALMQQSIELSNKNAATLAAMQRDVDQKLAEQQSKLVAPVASLGVKVDDMSSNFGTVRETVAELMRKVNGIEGKVTDISDVVRVIAAEKTAGPPPPNAGGTAAQAPDGPPAGTTPELAYDTAYKDYMAKNDQLALDEFAKYVQYFPKTANAPNAQYYIGQIYYRADDWDSATKAFDAVLESFPTNPKTSEAQYYKACALLKWNKKTAAVTEFKGFIKNYPESTHLTEAHKHLRELGAESTPARRKP